MDRLPADRTDKNYILTRAGLLNTLNSIPKASVHPEPAENHSPGNNVPVADYDDSVKTSKSKQKSSKPSNAKQTFANPAFHSDESDSAVAGMRYEEGAEESEEFGDHGFDTGESSRKRGARFLDDDTETSSFRDGEDSEMFYTEQAFPLDIVTASKKSTSNKIKKERDEKAKEIAKVIAYIAAFILFLGTVVLSKGSVLVAISNIRPHPVTNNANYDNSTTQTTTVIYESSTAIQITDEINTNTDDTIQTPPATDVTISENLQNFVASQNQLPSFSSLPTNAQMICSNYLQTIMKEEGNRTYKYGVNYTSHVSKCVSIPWGYDLNDNSEFSCLAVHDKENVIYSDEKTYPGDQCFVTRVYWVWSLFLMMCTPLAFVIARSVWRISFKETAKLRWRPLLCVFIIESLHTAGLCLFTFLVLPSLNDSISALLFMCCIATVPGVLKILFRPKVEKRKELHIIFDILSAIVLLATPFLLMAVVLFSDTYDTKHLAWAIPVSFLLISIRWWENYVNKTTAFNQDSENRKLDSILRKLIKMKRKIKETRIKSQLIVSIWKIGLTVLMMMVCVALQAEDMDPLHNDRHMNPWTAVFNFDLSWCEHFDNATNVTKTTITYQDLPELELDWVWVWLVNCTSSLLGYFIARSSAKMQIQRLCYALPLVLVTPLMLGLMIGGCELWNKDPCTFATSELSGYLFYKCYESEEILDTLLKNLWFLFPLWWLSQLWITWHVWYPKNERLAPAESLFVLPLYDAILFEQSMLINRKRDVSDEASIKEHIKISDEIPMVYICATMWHETEDEMMTLLKSLFRLDEDQAARRNAMKYMKVKNPDMYNFEGHIFFDDAYTYDKKTGISYLNKHVKWLMNTITPAAVAVHGVENLIIPPPQKFVTPYGGRMIWKMPGGNQIIVHLKDQKKIRKKKRWSQVNASILYALESRTHSMSLLVMYMYYFLVYKIYHLDKSPDEMKTKKLENTYILALDGDIDFEPHAVRLALDLMKGNKDIAATCGRIHPVGSGPMVWYQRFEYSLGHWMQKSTENVIGCVLCSPGCFSLFRGSALMWDNVMCKYATESTKPEHLIQYDQGEDRWLCLLLLKQGFRIAYCAASDSFTNSPAKFTEFFNQRRRWIVSTMANVVDLLSSWRQTTKVNENISTLYILYQLFLFVASIIGPGTIFMMMIGAVDIALGGRLGFFWSSVLNFIPLLIFIILCYLCSQKTQLRCAVFLHGLYILVQMLVLVGLIIQMAEMGICFPTTVFFIFVSGTFVLCGILHPQEILTVFHGFTYYLCIPTMYMLLMVYAVCNMHDVSWGTRVETLTDAEKQALEEKKAEDEEKRLQKEREKAGLKGSIVKKSATSGYQIRCGSLCTFSCCTAFNDDDKYTAVIKEIQDMREIQTVTQTVLTELNDKVGNAAGLEARIVGQDGYHDELPGHVIVETRYQSSSSSAESSSSHEEHEILGSDCHDGSELGLEDKDEEFDHTEDAVDTCMVDIISNKDQQEHKQDDRLSDADLREETGKKINEDEERYFISLQEKFLKPIEKTEDDKEKMEKDLKKLRNYISSVFLLVNAVFVVVISVMQMNTDVIFIPWPCGDEVRVEPIGFAFMMMFGVIMLIQIIGMIIHRTTTFFHIMATTMIGCGFKGVITENSDEEKVKAAKFMGRLDETEDVEEQDDEGSVESERNLRRRGRPTIMEHLKKKEHAGFKITMSINKMFQKRYREESDKAAGRRNMGDGYHGYVMTMAMGALDSHPQTYMTTYND